MELHWPQTCSPPLKHHSHVQRLLLRGCVYVYITACKVAPTQSRYVHTVQACYKQEHCGIYIMYTHSTDMLQRVTLWHNYILCIHTVQACYKQELCGIYIMYTHSTDMLQRVTLWHNYILCIHTVQACYKQELCGIYIMYTHSTDMLQTGTLWHNILCIHTVQTCYKQELCGIYIMYTHSTGMLQTGTLWHIYYVYTQYRHATNRNSVAYIYIMYTIKA